MKSRIDALRRRFTEDGPDAFLVSSPPNRRYLSGLTATDSPGGGTVGWLLVTPEDAVLFVGFLGLEQSRKECRDVAIESFVGTPAPQVGKYVQEHGIRNLAFEGNHLTFLTASDLTSQVGAHGNLTPIDGWGEELRAVKSPAEIEQIRRAAQLTDEAFLHLLDIVKPGMSERELAWEAEKYMREHGADGLAFDVGLGSGVNSALPHAEPSDRAIKPGEPIWIDMGARVDGYCSDLTRSFCLGEPDERFREVWDLVYTAQRVALDGCRAGMTGREVDSLARNHIASAGHGEEFGHSLGHGVGLVVHERPRLSQLATDTLENGMVVTFEPGVYIPGWGGVRIEDLGVVREEGVELLSSAPKPLVVD